MEKSFAGAQQAITLLLEISGIFFSNIFHLKLVDSAEEETMDKEAQLYSGGYVYVTIYYIIFVRYLASVDFGIHGGVRMNPPQIPMDN